METDCETNCKVWVEMMKRFFLTLLKRHSDKVLHFAITYGIVLTLATHWTLDGAIAVGILFGVAKEIYDKLSYGKFSIGDLLADILGIILAVLLGA